MSEHTCPSVFLEGLGVWYGLKLDLFLGFLEGLGTCYGLRLDFFLV